MPETSTATSPGQELSRGLDIEYKAFARSFQPDGTAAVLYLIATCYYKTSGFTIFIEEDSGQFNLMEQPPTGIFRDIVTYYVASWTNGVATDNPPAHVMIKDAQDEHKVHVNPWLCKQLEKPS